jgi:hypothetical protein
MHRVYAAGRAIGPRILAKARVDAFLPDSSVLDGIHRTIQALRNLRKDGLTHFAPETMPAFVHPVGHQGALWTPAPKERFVTRSRQAAQ